jgi:hypothetical protein
MNYENFYRLIGPAEEPDSFLGYFVKCLDLMAAAYVSLNRRTPRGAREFRATGVREAVAAYCWPAEFQMPPAEQGGATEDTRLLHWPETEAALNRLSSQLQIAIVENDNHRVLEHAAAILDWGMGHRGATALDFLKGRPDPSAYLRAVRSAASLDGNTDDLTPELVENCNAGLAKIHALASTAGLVIYDSRVAFTIGEIVNQWLLNRHAPDLDEPIRIPEHLEFMQAGRKDLYGAVQQPRGDLGHPVERRNYTWLQTQMRASWLFAAGLNAAPHLWEGMEFSRRMHRMEAAFFMFGAYSEILDLPESRHDLNE